MLEALLLNSIIFRPFGILIRFFDFELVYHCMCECVFAADQVHRARLLCCNLVTAMKMVDGLVQDTAQTINKCALELSTSPTSYSCIVSLDRSLCVLQFRIALVCTIIILWEFGASEQYA